MRRLMRFAGLLLLLGALGVALYLCWDYRQFESAPLAVGEASQSFEVASGDSLARIVARVRQQGLSNAPDQYWRVLGWRSDTARRLQVGEYEIKPGTTALEFLQQLHAGRVRQYRFTVVEGWNIRELRAALATRSDLVQRLAGADDAEMMQLLDRPGAHPEGRFLPETYAFVRGSSDIDVLKRAATAMDRAVERAWSERAPGVVVKTPEEALILASVIEKETGKASERRRIAGVFSRRLQRGMLLQTDPTVIYGVGDAYAGNITRVHLATDTPYNTYTRAGLPPTPIAMPGVDALRAAVDPAPGEELYFVARGDGSHEFTANLAAHNAAVAKYQLGRR